MLSSIISAAGNIAGGLFGMSEARANRDMQRRFARRGIQWRVEDARQAGVHPLAALGAQTHNPTPVRSGMSQAMSRAGQNLGRAAASQQGTNGRAQRELARLTIERANLENDILRQQLVNSERATESQPAQPPPGVVSELRTKPEKPKSDAHTVAGRRIHTNRQYSSSQALEDEYGELVSMPIGIANLLTSIYLDRQRASKHRKVPKRVRRTYDRVFPPGHPLARR